MLAFFNTTPCAAADGDINARDCHCERVIVITAEVSAPKINAVSTVLLLPNRCLHSIRRAVVNQGLTLHGRLRKPTNESSDRNFEILIHQPTRVIGQSQ